MWEYKESEFTSEMIENYVGFVYEIYNVTKHKYYIGKKLFTKSKTYQKNKKRKRMRVESDWITYTGSNEELNEDIKNGDSIRKRIIMLCTSKGWCSFYETKEILDRYAVVDPNYYNSWVNCKIHKNHLK